MAPVPDPSKLTSQDAEGTGDPAAWIMASECLWVPNLSILIFLSRGSKQRCSKNQRFYCSCPLFNIPDEAVPAIPVRHHLPSIGWHLVQAPGSRGRRPAWRLCPMAGKKERKASVHLIPKHFLWDKLQRLAPLHCALYSQLIKWTMIKNVLRRVPCSSFFFIASCLLCDRCPMRKVYLFYFTDEETMNGLKRLSNFPEDTQANFEQKFCTHSITLDIPETRH